MTNVVAIDWDNTCTDESKIKYPYESPIRKDCRVYLQKIKDLGYTTVLWTTRNRKYKFEVIERIFKEDIPFSMIFMSESERNDFHMKTFGKYLQRDKTAIYKELIEGRDKILANVFIDDKNIFCKDINWKRIYNELKKTII